METLVSYLPLSHITAQMCDLWAPLVAKCCVYFAPEDALKVGSFGSETNLFKFFYSFSEYVCSLVF